MCRDRKCGLVLNEYLSSAFTKDMEDSEFSKGWLGNLEQLSIKEEVFGIRKCLSVDKSTGMDEIYPNLP